MTTVSESLDALPVAELAEVREQLRRNAEERKQLEATAKRLLDAWTALALPPPPAPAPVQAASVVQVTTYRSLAERAVATVNSNAGRSFTALELAQDWQLTHQGDLNAIRSGLSRAASRGFLRRIAFGRYTSIYSAPGTR
jgi:hypothetical protein